jgi:hypothetical protein
MDLSGYQRIAVHFVDHEVLRGYSDRELRYSRYGVNLSLIAPDKSELKEMVIPFTAIKGIFYLKTWESLSSSMVESDWVPRVLESREREQMKRAYGAAVKSRRKMPLLERIVGRRKIAE